MSLIYNEFEGSDKNGNDEELKIEKMDLDSKKTKKKKTKRKKAKKNSEEKKELASDSKEKVIDKYDTSLEGLEIPMLNNNINNGSLMLTELLDIDNNKNNQEEVNNITNNNINNRTLNINENNNNSFLKKKLENVKLPKNLKNDINSGIEKSHLEIRDDFKNDLLNISNKKTTINDILGLNKSNGNIFLTSVDKISKENLKRLKSLKLEEKNIKKNIAKINMNTKLLEDGLSLKNNIVDDNIRKSQLKNMNDLKENFITKLIKVNQKIELILNEEKLSQKAKNKLDFENLDEAQEEYNLHLKKLKEEQNKNKAKFDSDLKIAYEKHQKFCDQLELEKSGKLEKLIKERKDTERKVILKRKKEADEILEKSKKYLNEKFTKKDNDYRYYQLKEKFENNEKKLIDKVNMQKKDPLITQEEIKELSKRIKEQKKLLGEDAEEKKKQLIKLWSYRSQTLPTYKHPLTVKLEEELALKMQQNEEDKKKKECNDLEKRNYQPPKVIQSQKLKSQRETRKDKVDRESVMKTELNNKKRLDRLKFTPIISPKNLKKIQEEINQEINNDLEFDIKSLLQKKKKKILKPIRILHPKPEKPIDYLTQMIVEKEKSKNKSIQEKTEDNIDIKTNLNNKISSRNEKNVDNIIDTLKMVKAQTETIDNKVQLKKQILKLNGGYLNNPKLGDEVGDLLIESIQTKLNIMNKLNGD
jgi:hypothetical protein